MFGRKEIKPPKTIGSEVQMILDSLRDELDQWVSDQFTAHHLKRNRDIRFWNCSAVKYFEAKNYGPGWGYESVMNFTEYEKEVLYNAMKSIKRRQSSEESLKATKESLGIASEETYEERNLRELKERMKQAEKDRQEEAKRDKTEMVDVRLSKSAIKELQKLT